MNARAYREAVNTAKGLIKSALDYSKDPVSSAGLQARMDGSAGIRLLRYEPDRLLELAKIDPGYFQALKLGVAYSIENGLDLPKTVKAWLASYLRDEIAPPKKAAGSKSKLDIHLSIYSAVGILVASGMTATRNDQGPSTSACDAVAEAMAELGLKPATFHGVKGVWMNMKIRVKS